jgi:hypothetical protein
MRTCLVGGAALALLLAAEPGRAADLGPATVVGRVTNTSSRALNRKIFVQSGARKWALHMNGSTKVYHGRRQVSLHEIDTSSWIKARGRRIGRLRLDVERIDIAGDRAAYRRSGIYRRSAPEGYYVAGYR